MRQTHRRRHVVVKRGARRPRSVATLIERGPVALLDARVIHTQTGPWLSGGDLDADWQSAASTGEEAVGGSVATPDQDIVDEIGRALGVEQDGEAEFRTTWEILSARDRSYWRLERAAAMDDDQGLTSTRDRR